MQEPSDTESPNDDLEVRVPLDELIAALSEPEAYGLEAGPIEVVQTHISVVFLAGERAYKVKKPARLWGLVDYGTVALRKHWCEEEVRLNRRLAPDLYLGVEPIVRRSGALHIGGDGDVVEHAVVMRRIDEAQSLGARLARGEAGESDVRDVARLLVRFHQDNRLPVEPGTAERVVDAFASVCRQNFEGTPVDDNPLFPPAVHRRLRRRFDDRLEPALATMRSRFEQGRAVDGHGDIRLDHVIRTDGGWIIMDCCEFAESLRHVDPLSDMAFLGMDLRAKGYSALAALFESRYVELADEADGVDLLPIYRAYRAYVRASVDYHTTRRSELAEETRARKAARAKGYFTLCWTETRRGAVPPLIVMRGLSGTGKSWLATGIAPYLDAVILRSDVVRKELLGLAPTERPEGTARDAAYSGEMHARTYDELLVRARAVLTAGNAVVLDATYVRHDSRAAALALARELGAPVAIVEATCPEAVVRERLTARSARDDDASDAGLDIYLQQKETDEPLDETERAVAVTHDTRAMPEEALPALLDVLDRQLEEPTA